jgi:hypothetical protein
LADTVFDRRSNPDLRSIADRLSPTTLFSSSVRLSTPLRRSLPERRPDRLSSIAIAISQFEGKMLRLDEEAVKVDPASGLDRPGRREAARHDGVMNGTLIELTHSPRPATKIHKIISPPNIKPMMIAVCLRL